MTIEVEFTIGDTIHFFINDRVYSSVIKGLKIERWADDIEGLKVIYFCDQEAGNYNYIKVPEHKAFATKQELLNSL